MRVSEVRGPAGCRQTPDVSQGPFGGCFSFCFVFFSSLLAPLLSNPPFLSLQKKSPFLHVFLRQLAVKSCEIKIKKLVLFLGKKTDIVLVGVEV